MIQARALSVTAHARHASPSDPLAILARVGDEDARPAVARPATRAAPLPLIVAPAQARMARHWSWKLQSSLPISCVNLAGVRRRVAAAGSESHTPATPAPPASDT